MDDAAKEMRAALADANVVVECEFVPRSKSPKPKEVSINWLVRVKVGSRDIMQSPYTQGIAWLKGYGGLFTATSHRKAWTQENLEECLESGRGGPLRVTHPFPEDVMGSLLQDATAIDSPDFEHWAEGLGFDKDSRKAKSIYDTCVKTGLKLRAGLGEDLFNKLVAISSRM